MADLIDKTILIGMGLEKKVKEVIDELQEAGKESSEAEGEGKKAGGEGEGELPPKQAVENRVVEDGVKVLKEFLSLLKAGRERVEKEVSSSSEKLLEKINAATKEDVDIVKEMARVAREKVDSLEKRMAELEERLKK